MTKDRPKRIVGADGVLRSPEAEQELNLQFARVFASEDAHRLLVYLKSITVNAIMGDSIETNALIHREGQRFIVGLIDRRIAHGRTGKPIEPASVDARSAAAAR